MGLMLPPGAVRTGELSEGEIRLLTHQQLRRGVSATKLVVTI
ncbi:hypothetical protein ABZ746_30200 [Streptomyces sp. NPDC020096]